MSNYLWLVIAAGALGVLYGLIQTASLMKASTGNDKMREIAAAIQEGASAYLRRQYTTIAMVGVVILIAAYFLIGEWAAIGFVIGAVLSGLAGFAGMLISVRANVRTAQAASESLGKGLDLAFRSGAITGMFVAGGALLGVAGYYAILTAGMGFESTSREVIDGLVALGFGPADLLFARLGAASSPGRRRAATGGQGRGGIPEIPPQRATIADNGGTRRYCPAGPTCSKPMRDHGRTLVLRRSSPRSALFRNHDLRVASATACDLDHRQLFFRLARAKTSGRPVSWLIAPRPVGRPSGGHPNLVTGLSDEPRSGHRAMSLFCLPRRPGRPAAIVVITDTTRLHFRPPLVATPRFQATAPWIPGLVVSLERRRFRLCDHRPHHRHLPLPAFSASHRHHAIWRGGLSWRWTRSSVTTPPAASPRWLPAWTSSRAYAPGRRRNPPGVPRVCDRFRRLAPWCCRCLYVGPELFRRQPRPFRFPGMARSISAHHPYVVVGLLFGLCPLLFGGSPDGVAGC